MRRSDRWELKVGVMSAEMREAVRLGRSPSHPACQPIVSLEGGVGGRESSRTEQRTEDAWRRALRALLVRLPLGT